MNKEKLRKHLLRQVNNRNQHWMFDGKSFHTEFCIMVDGIQYTIELCRTGEEMAARLFIRYLMGWQVEDMTERTGLFYGAESFEMCFGWLADNIAAIAESLAPQMERASAQKHSCGRELIDALHSLGQRSEDDR